MGIFQNHEFQVKTTKLKKSVSFKEEPEIETFDANGTKRKTRTVRKIVRVRRVRQSDTLYVKLFYLPTFSAQSIFVKIKHKECEEI